MSAHVESDYELSSKIINTDHQAIFWLTERTTLDSGKIAISGRKSLIVNEVLVDDNTSAITPFRRLLYLPKLVESRIKLN